MGENGLHKIPVMRTALEQIQELHHPNSDYGYPMMCRNCSQDWPCPTRKLADEALTDRMARTNQGENK